jgi:hypothetical protein
MQDCYSLPQKLIFIQLVKKYPTFMEPKLHCRGDKSPSLVTAFEIRESSPHPHAVYLDAF